MTHRLNHWYVVFLCNGGIALGGKVHGDSRRAEGTEVRTSPIISAEGRFVTTQSGSVYELGEVLELFLESNGPINVDHPLRVFLPRRLPHAHP